MAKRKRAPAPVAKPPAQPVAAAAPSDFRAPAGKPLPPIVVVALAGLVALLAALVAAPAGHPWPILVTLGRWLAAGAAALAAFTALWPLRRPDAHVSHVVPIVALGLGLVAVMALTGHNDLPARGFADAHPASFGLPTELAWVCIGVGVARLRSANDTLGRGALALGVGWGLVALLTPDVLYGRLVWAWSSDALVVVALLVELALLAAGAWIIIAPERAPKVLWDAASLAGPIAGALLIVTSLVGGALTGCLVGACLALLGPLAGLVLDALPPMRARLAGAIEGVVVTVVLLLWLLLKLHAFVPSNTDENIYFYMAKLVSDGKMPYADFFFAHPPLHVMLPGVAYTFFGPSITLGKLFPLVASGATGLALWQIARGGFALTLERPSVVLRATGVLAMVLFLFAAEPLKASSNMTGVNETTGWLALGALAYFRGHPLLAGALFGCAATTGFYAMAAICAFLALGMWRFEHRRFGLRQLAGFALVFGLINVIFWSLGGDAFLDGVYRYHGEKDLRDAAMVELGGDEPGMPWSFFHNLSVTVSGNPFTKEYFYHSHLWLGALALPLLAATTWLARRDKPAGFFNPKRLSLDGQHGVAATMWLVALALLLQFTLFRELYSFYFVLIYPFLAYVTAHVVFGGFAALTTRASAGRAIGLAGVVAPLIVAWHPAFALSNQTVFDDEVESLGERNEYTWKPAPALAWAPALSDVTRVLFWDDMRIKGDVEPGYVQYLRSKKREFEDLPAIAAWVQAHTRPDEPIAGASTLAPLIALEADRRLAADEVDTNSKRFEAGMLSDQSYWDAICTDGVKLIIASERSYFTEARMNAMPTAKRWFRLATVFEDDTLNYRRTFRIPIYERVGDRPCRYEPR